VRLEVGLLRACSFAGSFGIVEGAQICRADGIAAAHHGAAILEDLPRNRSQAAPSNSEYSSTHASTTRRTAAASFRRSLDSCRGEKQTTRQMPDCDSARSSSPCSKVPAGVSGAAPRSRSRRLAWSHIADSEAAGARVCRGHRCSRDRKPAARPAAPSPPALPRPLGPMRRHQDPLPGQRIQPRCGCSFRSNNARSFETSYRDDNRFGIAGALPATMEAWAPSGLNRPAGRI